MKQFKILFSILFFSSSAHATWLDLNACFTPVASSTILNQLSPAGIPFGQHLFVAAQSCQGSTNFLTPLRCLGRLTRDSESPYHSLPQEQRLDYAALACQGSTQTGSAVAACIATFTGTTADNPLHTLPADERLRLSAFLCAGDNTSAIAQSCYNSFLQNMTADSFQSLPSYLQRELAARSCRGNNGSSGSAAASCVSTVVSGLAQNTNLHMASDRMYETAATACSGGGEGVRTSDCLLVMTQHLHTELDSLSLNVLYPIAASACSGRTLPTAPSRRASLQQCVSTFAQNLGRVALTPTRLVPLPDITAFSFAASLCGWQHDY